MKIVTLNLQPIEAHMSTEFGSPDITTQRKSLIVNCEVYDPWRKIQINGTPLVRRRMDISIYEGERLSLSERIYVNDYFKTEFQEVLGFVAFLDNLNKNPEDNESCSAPFQSEIILSTSDFETILKSIKSNSLGGIRLQIASNNLELKSNAIEAISAINYRFAEKTNQEFYVLSIRISESWLLNRSAPLASDHFHVQV